MFRRIDRGKIVAVIPDREQIRRDAAQYLQNRKIYEDIRSAYKRGRITQDQAVEIQRMVKAGGAREAEKELQRRMYPDV